MKKCVLFLLTVFIYCTPVLAEEVVSYDDKIKESIEFYYERNENGYSKENAIEIAFNTINFDVYPVELYDTEIKNKYLNAYSLLGNSIEETDGIITVDNINKIIENISGKELDKPEMLSGLMVNYYGDKEFRYDIYKDLAYLPDGLLDKFNSLGWEINFADNNIGYYHMKDGSSLEVYGTYAGLTNYKEKKVYIRVKEDLNGEFSSTYSGTILHEIGHVIFTSEKELFNLEQYNCIPTYEKDELARIRNSTYCKVNDIEYVAEAFSAYCLNNESLKESAPCTYTYIDTLVKMY